MDVATHTRTEDDRQTEQCKQRNFSYRRLFCIKGMPEDEGLHIHGKKKRSIKELVKGMEVPLFPLCQTI